MDVPERAAARPYRLQGNIRALITQQAAGYETPSFAINKRGFKPTSYG